MANTKTATSALPYLQRLLEDDYVQEQLLDAAAGLRTAYGRAAYKRAQAAEDKKLYSSLRRAATSIRNAAIALRQAPEPPPKHRGRNILIIAFAVGATIAMTKWAQQRPEAAWSETPAAPASPPPSEPAGAVTGAPAKPAPTTVVSP
jgi:hypothetical protein